MSAQENLFPEPQSAVADRVHVEIMNLLSGKPGGPMKIQLSADERLVLTVIRFHRGLGNAVSIDDLQKSTKLNPRLIKRAVRGLRLNFHLPIGSSKSGADGGYYLMITEEDREVWVRCVVDQIRAEAQVLRAAAGEQAAIELFGQLRLIM